MRRAKRQASALRRPAGPKPEVALGPGGSGMATDDTNGESEHKRIRINNVDMTEIYSPPRVARFCRDYSLSIGGSLDLTTTDEKGEPWESSIRAHNNCLEATLWHSDIKTIFWKR